MWAGTCAPAGAYRRARRRGVPGAGPSAPSVTGKAANTFDFPEQRQPQREQARHTR